ncbi:glycosyltransferase family 2 protein [Labilibaculum euxinus]|uniref:glycosyltransferase family 2 protein n=1 Tax=Labilibaculum euxinus TaxID=2686357 RepID=UPI000F6250C6|nr:glycosyltransferase family 2 protein [Labilibaculum euxinus]MDQ1772765.1 glycosyltransferase family 2 protein [Labilibaculum euxinus]
MEFTVTLLITTYNNPKFLDLVFRSILKQTVMPNEIVVGDDGSKEETKQVIDQYRSMFQCNVKHIWHEDNGFQKCKILNKTIAQVSSDYIIQIDGDIMIHPRFIEDHISVASSRQLICGNRSFVRKKRTMRLLDNPSSNNLNLIDIKKRKRFFRIPKLSLLYRNKRSDTSRKGSLGCNFAYWKEDIVKINGYNEDFTGWGYEDIEMVERLMNSGVRKTTLLFMAVEYHLYHPKSDRASSEKNKRMYYDCVDGDIAFCVNGIDKYL